MRAVLQRARNASVIIDGKINGKIIHGFVVLLGIGEEDNEEDVSWLAQKIVNQRVFSDEDEKMNLSLSDIEGEILLISQFTLHASTKKGNRPSFIKAARPEKAIPLYESMIIQLQDLLGKPIATGVFGADMQVALTNDGPVTIIIDTKNKE